MGRVGIKDGERTYTFCRKHANAYNVGASFMPVSEFLQKRADDPAFKEMTDRSVAIIDGSVKPGFLQDTVNQGLCNR